MGDNLHGMMFNELTKSIVAKVDLSEEDLNEIRKFFIPKKVRKRQYVLNAGDVAKHLVFVEKGMLRSFSVDEKGREHVMQFATEGWWIGDIASFLSGDEAIYNIESVEDAELLLLTQRSMNQLTEEIPRMERYFRLLMQDSLVAFQRRLRVVQTHSAEDAYLKLMESRPDVITRAPQQYIALYLGITPETLSRVRKKITERKRS